MEHYYVVTGNEYGINLDTKKNFINLDDACTHFEEVKFDDFACTLRYVKASGVEVDIETFINE